VGEDRTGEPQANRERLTVAQTAVRLGITEGAVRSRIKRGTLPTSKEGGNVFVLLGGSTSQTNQATNIGVPGDQSALIEALRDQIEDLRRERDDWKEQARMTDRLLSAAMERIPPQLEAPQEPSESPETVEEEPERAAAPHPSTGETQEVTPRPQQRSGWLAPVDKLPWWHYVLGFFLVFSGGFLSWALLQTFALRTTAPAPPGFVVLPIALAIAWSSPGIFGFWAGYRKRNLRLWSQVLPLGALVGAVAFLGYTLANLAFLVRQNALALWGEYWFIDNLQNLALVLFPVWLLFVSASLVGNTWQRRRIGRVSGTTPASPVSRTTQGAAQQPRKDLTPAQQALLGWGGTIISALITLVGTIVAVGSGG
jgi:hypothetical protein